MGQPAYNKAFDKRNPWCGANLKETQRSKHAMRLDKVMVKKHTPIDLDIARTPKTRCPFHCMTLPPAASILAYSSSRFG